MAAAEVGVGLERGLVGLRGRGRGGVRGGVGVRGRGRGKSRVRALVWVWVRVSVGLVLGFGLKLGLRPELELGSAWSASIWAVTPVAISSSLIDRLAHC